MAIELRKGDKISLEKKSGVGLGEIIVNLNWNQGGKGFSLFKKKGVDLDLGCLYEMKDGNKGCVQALGGAFGNFNKFPFILLDGDDRTGASLDGETLRVNGGRIAQFKRILIYTFIYEGAADWRQVDGLVTVKYPGAQDIIVRMDEYGSTQTMCGIALLENQNNETFQVSKFVQFFSGHEAMDRAFGWGMRWVAGRK
ncbi:MAG: TerD family protein [Treponema sp.]|jgi:tellurite resistance protein TerA|nr:TerD family protein [Treponema sp.]